MGTSLKESGAAKYQTEAVEKKEGVGWPFLQEYKVEILVSIQGEAE